MIFFECLVVAENTIGHASIWRIECDYDWIDSKASTLTSISVFAQKSLKKTTSGGVIPLLEEVGLSRKMDYSIDFDIIHQV